MRCDIKISLCSFQTSVPEQMGNGMGKLLLRLRRAYIESRILWLEDRLIYRREIVADYDRAFKRYAELEALGVDKLDSAQREEFIKLGPAKSHQARDDYRTHRRIAADIKATMAELKLELAEIIRQLELLAVTIG